MANKIHMPSEVPSGLCVFNCGNECIALTKKKCINCKFRKTAVQLTESRKKCHDRLVKIGAHELLEKYWNAPSQN